MKQVLTNTRNLFVALLALVSLSASAQKELRRSDPDNRVAVLPINYIGDGNDVKMGEMRYRLQSLAHQFLQKDAIELRFQDPTETNALLRRHGVTEENLRDFMPSELADFLQVEYVIMGTVTEEFGSVITHRNSNVRRSTHVDEYYRHGHVRSRENRSGTTSTRQEINTMIDLSMYNDKGVNIYSRERRSLLSDPGTYKVGLHYLLKRSPLYKR